MNGRQGGDHARVTLVGHQANLPGLDHSEVRPGEADIRVKKDLSQPLPGGRGEVHHIFAVGYAELLHEGPPDVRARQVYCRGDDMSRVLPAQLHDPLPEIRLDHFQPGALQSLVQADLLAEHGFRFCQPPGSMP